MSVPRRKRIESKVQFISTAQDIVECCVKLGTKIPKRYKSFGSIEPYNLSIKILNAIICANTRNPKTDLEQRTEYFKQAFELLNCLTYQLNLLLLYVSSNDFTDNAYEHLGILIATEKKLIKGIMTTDNKGA